MIEFLSLNALEMMTPLAVDTLQTGLIITLMVLSSVLTIYNLPWTHTELTETHRQTRTYFQHLKRFLSEHTTVSDHQALISGALNQNGHRLNRIDRRIGESRKLP